MQANQFITLLGRASKPIVPSIISAANRSRVPQQSGTGAAFGSAVAGNAYGYWQYRETPPKAAKGIRPIYANVVVSSATTTLRSDINNANEEQGVGSTMTIRFAIVTNIQGTTGDQTGATITTGLFSDAANDRSITVGNQTVSGCIWKLDNSVANAPTFTRKTYAQFQSDGGSISSSTVDGSSVANTQIAIPDSYVVIADAGPDVSANTPYYVRLEERVPIITVTSIDGTVANTIVVNTTNTDIVRVGNVGTIAGATGNTSVNGVWQVSAVNPNVSITFTSPTSTAGAVTGTPTLKFTRPSGVVNASVTFNPLGDYNRASATQRDVMGSNGKNWLTGVGANVAGDGGIFSGFAAIIGTDPTGGETIYLDGDSIAAEVRDGQTNNPAATLAGDSVGNLEFLNRAMYANGLPSIRTAVPGMKALNSYTKHDDQFRLWLAGFCDRAITEMGHNDMGDASVTSYTIYKQFIIARWDRFRTAMRGKKFVIPTSLSPLTTSTDSWTSTRSAASQTFAGAFAYPGGMVYANYYSDLLGGTLITGAAGGADGFLDLALLIGNLDGSNTVNGYWPVDGVTAFKYTTDGTHLSKDGAAGVASQITSSVLRTAKIIT